jgi:hypothetical protein
MGNGRWVMGDGRLKRWEEMGNFATVRVEKKCVKQSDWLSSTWH